MFKKILVVDDDKDILYAIQLILEDEGYEVTTTENGEKVEDLVTNIRPNLIILDMLLSGIDGRDICINLKQHSSTRQIPILMMSAHPTAQQKVVGVGANAFIAKPFKMEKLLTKIKQLIV